jgi:hypothetical protein
MTAEEFNDLPLAARQFIEKQQGCLSCGNAQDIDSLYKKYQIVQKKSLFTLRTGAVSYKTDSGAHGVLYPIHPKDSEEKVKEKLQTALIVFEKAPGRFSDFQEEKIKAILTEGTEGSEGSEGSEEKAAKPLFGAAKKAAEAKAAKEAESLD